MTHALVLVLLTAGAGDLYAQRPKTHPAPKAKPAPKPPPPPEEPDEPDERDVPDEPDEPEVAPNNLPPPALDDDPFSRGRYSEKDLQQLGGAVLCTCFCLFAGLIALIVFIVKRVGGSKKPAAPAQAQAPPAAAPPAAAIPFHLSVLAVGMHADARQEVAQQLILAGVQADPVSAPERAQLVRELARAMRGLEAKWTHFGYGERLDLADDASAQQSYQRAVEDFSHRSTEPSLSGESTYVVLTLILCTRRQLRGVSSLDDRSQIRALLDDRTALADTDLMGAYLVWSSPLGGHEVLTRFPEMHAVQ